MKKILFLLSLIFIRQINANTNSILTVTITPPIIICKGTPCQFSGTANPGPIVFWQWSCKPSTGVQIQSANSDTTIITFPNNTTYTITLVTINGSGQVDSNKTDINVNPLPILSVHPKTVSGCSPICVAYSNSTAAIGACIWNFDDGSTTTSCAPIHCWQTARTYTPTLKFQDQNGCTNTDTAYITAFAVPTAIFTYTQSTCCNNAYFTDSSYMSSGDSIVTWNWTFHNGNTSSSTSQYPGVIALNFGIDTICLTVTSSHGCIDTTCKLVNETIMTVNELNNSSSISIYPNPTSDQFSINANTMDKLIVDLYDGKGIRVFNKTISDKSIISVTTLDEGVYTLTIKTADRVINKKIVILR